MCDWDSLQQSINLWTQSGAAVLPGRSETEIRNVLSRLGRPYCDDVVRLYEITGGMLDYEYGDGFVSLWSLERLASENERSISSLLLFGDFLISSHCYGFAPGLSGKSSVCIEHFSGEPIRVADSPQEFFRKYLDRSDDLLLLWD
jgi:hypothetical protein